MYIFVFLIILYFFMNYLFKKAEESLNIEEILMKSGYYNIQEVYRDKIAKYYTALKSGDNYLISHINEPLLSMNSVNLLAKEMKERHYHRGLIICNPEPKETLIMYGKVHSIEVISVYTLLKNKTKINVNMYENSNTIFENYQESKEDSPIMEPKKSHFVNLFKKPDRL